MYRVGIDVGGTFTDAVAVNEETGESLVAKNMTTPEEPSIGVMRALKELDIRMEHMTRFGHGFTTGINAVLTRGGAKTALLFH